MNKIFIVYYDLGLGGIQRKIVDIANYLTQEKRAKVVILFRYQPGKFHLGSLLDKRVTIFYFPQWSKIRLPFSFPVFVFWKVYREHPRAILAFSDMPGIVSVWSKMIFFWRKMKVVISEDRSLLPSKEVSSYCFPSIRHLLIKVFYPVADKVFCVNRPFSRNLTRTYNLPPEKIKLIINWVSPSLKRKTRLRKNYDFIYMGRFAKVKNLGFLIEMVSRLKVHFPRVRFCLVGQGEEENSLKLLVKNCHLERNVFFFKPKVGVGSFYNQARVFVLPSKSEGLPMAALEAMAYGLPVLSADYPGVKELLGDNRIGLIFKDQTDFMKKARFFLGNPERLAKMGVEAKSYVKHRHSIDNMEPYFKALGI